jgi:hypothetical protein
MVADAQRSGGMSTSAFPLVMHTHFWKRIGKSGLLKLRFRLSHRPTRSNLMMYMKPNDSFYMLPALEHAIAS